jgi:phosphoribosylformimino-5-aminoimidazole carboxamide ribotide isomerase
VIIYPAIDLRGGRCVRLVEGDFARETAFDADPADAATRFAAAGAQWLHVVDLDGAKAGAPVNTDAIARIRAAITIPMQLGGGIRTDAHIDAALAAGVDRVILGSVAIQDPAFVERALARWGDRIAIGLDARDGKLAASGWLEQTGVLATDLARRLAAAGARTFIFTDIRRDGTLQGPNLDALREMVAVTPDADVIASGGVGAIGDIDDIVATGASGAIVGRALYDGRVDLAEAIARGATEATR